MSNSLKLNSRVRNGSAPKASAAFMRWLTKREVCLTTLFIFCCISILASLSQFPYRAIRVDVRELPEQSVDLELSMRPHYPLRYERDVLWTNERDPSFVSINTYDIKRQSLLTLQKKRKDFGKINIESAEAEKSNDKTIVKNSAKPRSNASVPDKLFIASSNSSFQVYVDNADLKTSYDVYTNIMTSDDVDYYEKVDPARIELVRNVEKFVRRKRVASYYRQPVEELPKQTRGIIILTNYRSGSTFLGELFNQNPKAFYMFEPLFPFTGSCLHQRQLKVKVIHQLLQCDFPSMTELYRQVKGPIKKNHVDILCLVDDFCFRKHTKELCQTNLCPFKKPASRYCKTCGPVHRPLAMNACRKKRVSVVKVIRLCNILDLKPLVMDPTMDIKIVHLVRDPRGIESSRKKIDPHFNVISSANETCDRLLHNGLSGIANRSNAEWLKGKYMRVRYEDLSLKPLITAEKIYKFADMQLLPEIQTWIKSNTQAQTVTNKVNPYSTKRDSAAAMQSWRTHLSLDEVLEIQSICSETMDFYGYKAVKNKKELENLDELLL